jgi:type I restriction enzyme, S subunit
MSQEEIVVPKGWELKNLGSLIELVMGQAPPSDSYNSNKDGVPLVKVGEFGEVYPEKKIWTTKPTKYAKENDVLLCVVGATIGKINFGIDCCVGRSVAALRPDQSKLLQKFLFYFLSKEMLKIRSAGQGSAQGVISKPDINNMKIPTPPIEIQKQVVTKLDHILGEIEVKKKEILSLIEQNKQRIEFFEKKWREYSITNILTKYPKQKEWKQVNFDDVCQKITYGFTNPMPHVEDGAWLITATNIRNGKINYTHALKTDWKSFNELITDKSRPKIGTVLIIKDGNTLGRVGIVDRENICISQSVASLEPITSKILSQFLAFVLESSEIQQKIVSEIKLNTIPHIQITSMAKWTFLLPPVSTQKQIIQIIKSTEQKFQTQKKQFENIKNNYDSKIKYINHIQSSILDSAFSGKLLN